MPNFLANTLTVSVVDDNGESKTFEWLKYGPIGSGVFGRTSKKAFLAAGGVPGRPLPTWVDTLLAAKHGQVTTQRRTTHEATFSPATAEERAAALAHLNEIRPPQNMGLDPEDLEILVVTIINEKVRRPYPPA